MNQNEQEKILDIMPDKLEHNIAEGWQEICNDLIRRVSENENDPNPSRALRLVVMHLKSMGFLTVEDTIDILSKIDSLHQQVVAANEDKEQVTV